MDKELEDQINAIVDKHLIDMKTKILKIVTKHQTKMLKEQAKEIKNGASTALKGKKAAPITSTSSSASRPLSGIVKKRHDDRRHDDRRQDDNDSNYSE